MKMTMKLLSLLLCAALFMEFCPLDALAAGNIASESALETAWALSGQDPDAAHWHRGMTPEATWNAEQLDEWLDYVLSEPLFSVQNAHSDMRVNLYKMQESAPSDYNRLKAGANGRYLEYMTGASYRAEDLRQQLRAYRTDFIMYADRIAGLIAYIRDDSVSEREKIRYSRQLENAVAVIRQDRAEVVANYRDWLEQIDAWHADFTGESNASGQAGLAANGAGGAGLGDWVKEVMSWHEDPIKTTVSVALHPDGSDNSVLAKLSTAHSALAAQETDTQTIHVIPDTQFVVNLNTPVEIVDPSANPGPAPSPIPVLNGTVTVYDVKDVRNPDTNNPYSTAAVTDFNGDATFNVSEFTVDKDGYMDLGVVAQADGYQTVKHYVAQVQKGGVYAIPMTPEGEAAQAANDAAPADKPYFYDFEFNRAPAFGMKAYVYYTPENDVISDIVVGVVFPAGYSGSRDVTLKYFDVNETDPETKVKGTWVTATVQGKDAKTDPEFKGRGTSKLYTFSKKWNQTLGPGKEVSCYIGKESDGLVADNIRLTVERGVVDRPIVSDSGTGAMTEITETFGDVGNLFRVQLPSDLMYPFGGSALELNLPFIKYLPKISYDIDGTLTIAYGLDLAELKQDPDPQPSGAPAPTPAPKRWYEDHTWKSKTKKEIDDKAELDEKASSWAKYKAKCGAMWDGCQQRDMNFLGSATLSTGAFAMITGQFAGYNEPDESKGFYYNCRNLSGTLGAIGTFNVDFTWQILVAGHVSLDISTSLALGLTLGGEWNNFDPVHSNFGHIEWSGTTGYTLMVKLILSVTLGAGARGLVSGSITGYGYINIMLAWTLDSDSGASPWVRITAGAGVSCCLEIFWVKYTIDIWNMTEKELLNEQKKQSAFNLLDLYAAPALAEEDDAPEAMTPAEPEYYPALVPEATRVMDDVSMRDTTVKYAELGGETFAFYIAATEDGKPRLTWRNLETGQTGNAQAALQEIADAQEDECGVKDRIDYAFDVQGESSRKYLDLHSLEPTLIVTVLCTSRVTDEKVEIDGKTVVTKAPTDSFAYYLILTSDGNGGLKNLIVEGTIESGSKWIRITRHGFKSLPLEFACADIDMATYELTGDEALKSTYGIFLHGSAREYIPHSENKDVDTGRNINIYIHFRLPDLIVRDSVSTSLSSDIPLLTGNTVRYQCGSTFPVGLRETKTAWYALERAGDDGPGMLVHGMDGVDRNPLTSIRGKDANDDVVFYTVLHDGRTEYAGYSECIDSVFFLARTEDGNGDHYWLKQAAVKTIDGDTSYFVPGTAAYTVTDYDVEIKSRSFFAQKVNGVIYVYWLATAQKEKEADPDVYRIKSVVYDPNSDTMSNELVLAEFSMPEAELVPANLFLSENGMGYCTAIVGEGSDLRADVYSFPMNWITSLELNAMTLSDTHANPAKWLDTVVSVMNSGNTGISRFDLELYNVKDDGTETVVETLHCDCLDPEKSAIYEGDRLVSNGDHTIQRLEDGVKPMQQPDHNVMRQKWTRDSGFTNVWDQYFDSAMLLPGAVRTYSMPLYIPAGWEGYKKLFLRVKTTATRANWLAANVAAGNAVKSNALNAALDPEQNPEIVYTRAADGAMVRTDNANLLLAADGNDANAALSFSPLYPDRVRGTAPLALNHDIHDLDVSHRVYCDANGYEYIAITFMNQADTGRPMKLDAHIYMDGDSEPMEVALPYYPDKTTDSYTHTVTLRLDDLLGGRHPRNAKVVIEPEGVEETALRNNQFMLHFNDDDVDDPLRIVLNPSPVSALPGETANFKVKAAGGVMPYAYLWQVWMGEKTGWKDIPDSDSPTLTVENVTLAMHGRKARCVVTDHYLNRVVSDDTALTVIGAGGGDLPETGDDTNLPLYIAVALLGLALLWWIRRREKSM